MTKKSLGTIIGALVTLVICLSLVVGAIYALFDSGSKSDMQVTAGVVDFEMTCDSSSADSAKDVTANVSCIGFYMAKQLTVGNDSTSTTITLKNKSTIGTVYCVQIEGQTTNSYTVGDSTITLNTWQSFNSGSEINFTAKSGDVVTVIVAQANLVAAGSTASTPAAQS
jgi:hypothetical protein